MASTLPEHLDIRRLTAAGAELSGELGLGAMRRLTSMLLDDTGSVSVLLRFHRDELGRRLVEGSLSATVVCRCQRCLEPVSLALDREVVLECIWGESQLDGMDRAREPLLLEDDVPLETAVLVEDELILALPVIASHPQGGCQPPSFDAGDQGNDTDDERAGPFAELDKLKQGR